MNTKKL